MKATIVPKSRRVKRAFPFTVRGFDNLNRMVLDVQTNDFDVTVGVELFDFRNPFGIVRIDVYDAVGFVARFNVQM